MNKKGFTLAEVLLTLTIVGVLAAITLPNFHSSASRAQIGPKLAKAVAAFEQANATLVNENSSERITEVFENGNFADYVTYGRALGRYLKISQVQDNEFISKDGIKYTLIGPNNPAPEAESAHRQCIGMVSIDINGSSLPNKAAEDIFWFTLWNDGSLRPIGAINWNGGVDSDPDNAPDADGGDEHWRTRCAIGSVPDEGDLAYCTGHIFENNLKVLYE